jgi:Rrf2 family protein
LISKKTKYAIHALVHLAKKYEKGPVLIGEISKQQRIPKKFLEAILLELKGAGILGSKKGKGGGYYLIRKPADVHLAEVMRLFGGAIALLPCVTYVYYERCDECKDEETCGLRDVVMDVRNQTVAMLKESTLENVIKREQRLAAKKKKK